MERKLLAVVAADMLGFSRLIEDDEINLLSRQKNQLNTIIKPEIENFNGEIIKTTGDGFLAIFPSALDAVQSSISIQNGIYENELDNANDKRIRFRIGIHVGDVVLDDGDIFAPWCNTFVFNLTQQPASSVPCGRTSAGLPVGLQIVGRPHDDVGVLRIAKAFENTETYKVTIPLD